ncbi:GNAT family N-acetyltransferase [Priestia koreensis]|uniref:GNAT family N-acetyltransferase n=1 Tax=Priestia koreensis TaxID=284581 RepID=UPI001F5827DD|nr:GNAT family N-acetyltransferase [Priestia koreensis]UNL83171.1 GNAT family N-acetyltransferase [Priestia koreensis]
MAGFTVRQAQQPDVNNITILMYEYIVDFYQCPKPPLEHVQGIIHTMLRQQEGIQFVAEEHGHLIGFATLYFTYSTTSAQKITVMNDLYLVEEARGGGAATALFKACHEYSLQNGFVRMTWETAKDNQRAQRFYEKMGGEIENVLIYSL